MGGKPRPPRDELRLDLGPPPGDDDDLSEEERDFITWAVQTTLDQWFADHSPRDAPRRRLRKLSPR
jgi:hypothetical protein